MVIMWIGRRCRWTGEGGVETQRFAGFELSIEASGSEEFAQARGGAVAEARVGGSAGDAELIGELLVTR
jgi:hypothetical protein